MGDQPRMTESQIVMDGSFPAESGILTAPLGALLDALDHLAPLCARQDIPILEHVVIDRHGIRATDHDRFLYWPLPSHAEVEPFTMPAAQAHRLFKAWRREMPADTEIRIAPKEGTVSINAGDQEVTLPSDDPNDSPTWNDGRAAGIFRLPARALHAALAPVRSAMSKDQARYYLNGVNMEIGAGKMTLTATDGHRLISRTIEHGCAGAPPSAIIPKKTIQILLGLLDREIKQGRGDDMVSIEIGTSPSTLLFGLGEGGWMSLHSKVIDGTYPDWRRVVPQDEGDAILVDVPREALLRATRTAMTLNGPRACIGLKSEGDTLRVRSRSADMTSDYSCRIALHGRVARPIEWGVNARYLAEMLQTIHADHITIGVLGERQPLIFRAAGALVDSGDVSILMPMRI